MIFVNSINVLKILLQNQDLFFTDPVFFMYSTEVLANEPVDFEVVSLPNSLEVAFAILEMTKILGLNSYHELPVFKHGVVKVIKYILVNEGYSSIVEPFDVVGITDLAQGQHLTDTLDKKKAIVKYVSAMYS